MTKAMITNDATQRCSFVRPSGYCLRCLAVEASASVCANFGRRVGMKRVGGTIIKPREKPAGSDNSFSLFGLLVHTRMRNLISRRIIEFTQISQTSSGPGNDAAR